LRRPRLFGAAFLFTILRGEGNNLRFKWLEDDGIMSSVALDNVVHGDWRLIAGYGAAFGDSVNQVAVFASEYREASRHYPILLRREEDGSLQALAILGLDHDENLFLEEPRWTADYVPALLRRGPFRLVVGGDEAGIEIEPENPRIVKDGNGGLPLFLEHGGHGPALEAGIEALRVLHIGLQAAGALTALFDKHGLVSPVNLTLNLAEDEEINFEGYLAVSEERLQALDGAALEELNLAGLLMPAIYAAGSLDNFRGIIDRKLLRRG
jgi:hypothetical protein